MSNLTDVFADSARQCYAARITKLEDSLRKCIETLDDLQRVLRLLNRPILADACAVAADSSRDVLTQSAKETAK